MAKPAAAETPTKPTKKKRGAVARAAGRRHARARERAAPRRSNPEGGELVGTLKSVGIGVGAYGGTRLLQRIVWTVTSKKRPRWGKHAHALAGVGAFAAVLFGGRKIKAAAPYIEAVLMGTGVAAVQGVVSAYVPRYSWLMNDCRPDELAGGAQPQLTETNPSAAGSMDYLEEQLADYERGGPQKRHRAPARGVLESAAAADGGNVLDGTLEEELGAEDIDDLYGGVFEDPTLAI